MKYITVQTTTTALQNLFTNEIIYIHSNLNAMISADQMFANLISDFENEPFFNL